MKTSLAAGAPRSLSAVLVLAIAFVTSSALAQTWSSADVGAVGAAGSSSVSGGVYTVRGAGEDVFGPADEFHYHYRSWTGDGVFIVRVTSIENTFNWAKAGVMIRSALTTNAQHAYAFVSPEMNTSLVYRTATGGDTTSPTAVHDVQKSMPVWLRLVRAGERIVMDYSNDGVAWFRRGETTIAFPSSVYVGLAVNSHVDARLCTATFDSLTVDSIRPSALYGIARAPTKVFLRWQDNDVDESGFEIERSTDGVTFTRIGTATAWQTPIWRFGLPPPAPPSFTDTTVTASRRYFYRVRAVTARGPSAYSNVVSVTTPAPPPSGWFYEDVGDTALTGTSSESAGVFTVSGAGSGVGSVHYRRESQERGDFGVRVTGFSDEFQHCWRTWSGEGEIVARISGFSSAAGYAGVMVRTSSDPSGFHVFCYSRAGGTGFGVMTRPGTYTGSWEPFYYQRETFHPVSSLSSPPPPFWLKLQRLTDGVLAYRSDDGVNWMYLAWVATPLTAEVQFGLAVSSERDHGFSPAPELMAAQFDNVRVGTITTPPPAPQPPTNLHATQVLQTSITLQWTNPEPLYDGVEMERSTDGINFTARGRLVQGMLTDTALTADTTYYYRGRTVRGTTRSAYSPVLTVRTQAYPAAPTNLVATAVSSTQINLTWTDNSTNEDGFFLERSTDNVNFSWIASPARDATSHSVTGLTPGVTYYFRVYPYPSGTRAYSNTASATTPTGDTPPPPTGETWQSRDIGAVAAAGSSSESGGGVTVRASGADIWNTADEFHYRFQAWSGDGTITVRLTGLTNTHGWAKAGVMFRESLTAGSRHAMMIMSISHGTALQYRATTGGESGSSAPSGLTSFPRWLRLVRSGSTFTGFVSGDGATWTQAGTITLAGLPAGIYVGLAATSHNDGVVTTATFDNLSLTGPSAPAPTPPAAPSNLRVTRLGPEGEVGLAWDDNSTNETGFIIEAELDVRDTFPERLATVGANVTQYVARLGAGRPYRLAVKAVNGAGESGSARTSVITSPSMSLTVVSATADTVRLHWQEVLFRDDTLFGGPYSLERSTNGTSFTVLASGLRRTDADGSTHYTDSTVTPAQTYYYRVRYYQSEDYRGGYSNAVTASAQSGSGSGWQSQDVGAVAIAGSSSESGGRVTLTGSGADIWNTADEFHYRHQAWNGDGEIIARVTSLQNTHGWAKAGVMFRESLTADSRHAMMIVSIAHGTALQYRTTLGGESGSTTPTGSASGVPRWLRLVRSGSTFTGYASADGSTWTLAGSITIPLPASIYVGLAVTSHNDGVACTAAFENVTLSGGGSSPTTPPNPPGSLAATAISASQINLAWSDNSTNESGFEVESSTNNSTYTRLTTTTANVTSFSHTGLSAGTTYFYRVRAINSAGASSYTAPVSATTQTAPPPSSTWTSQDVGAVGVAGTTSESGGTMTVRGSGRDIWDTADAFRFVHRTMNGDGQIVARVTSVENTDGWAKAGVMMRASLDANAPNAFLYANPSFVTGWQHRSTAGGTTLAGTKYFGWPPAWVKLVRAGNVFTAYRSHDGVGWTVISSVTVAMPATIHVGLAVTSHNNAVLCSGVFDNVVLGGESTPPPTTVNAPSGLSATAAASTQINLAWTDNSTNETEFQIQRSPDNSAWTTIATRGANTTSYSDTTVSAGTTYHYRVRAAASGTSSSWSNTASATTPGATPPPPTWSFGDIGTVGIAGSNESSGNTITVRASGADVWGTADGFRFVYRTMTGDCVVEAEVSSLTNTHSWAKAGVMIRESSAANARNVFAFVTPATGIHAQHRAAAGGTTVSTAGQWWVSPPRWVRLVRSGNRITAFHSTNGTSWTQFATYDVTFGATALVGFAVTSHDNTQLATAVFTDPFVQ